MLSNREGKHVDEENRTNSQRHHPREADKNHRVLHPPRRIERVKDGVVPEADIWSFLLNERSKLTVAHVPHRGMRP